jgi:hypothetical protein
VLDLTVVTAAPPGSFAPSDIDGHSGHAATIPEMVG